MNGILINGKQFAFEELSKDSLKLFSSEPIEDGDIYALLYKNFNFTSSWEVTQTTKRFFENGDIIYYVILKRI